MPPNTITVKFVDNATGKSVSFTVYGQDRDIVAEKVERFLRGRYRMTKLNDRRHKQRGF
ncbi:MAG TPA: hypothetical protein VM243_14715 [Phycisphaerae bacterium]|nr:hypothetical protein [Phycisphaerae bacterium]HUW32887.1 hypothetical protein [Planctomycetota bacterium]